jgi:hypothetical protein
MTNPETDRVLIAGAAGAIGTAAITPPLGWSSPSMISAAAVGA